MWTDSVHISLTQLLDGPNYMALLGLSKAVDQGEVVLQMTNNL